MVEDDSFTLDSIWNKKINILQPARGYRFALDAVLLAHFLKIDSNEQALEIGSGSGVITILLSRFQKFQRVVAVEVQHSLAELSKKNFHLNSILNAEVLEEDIRNLKRLLPANSFDLLFSNPPYRKAGTGKLNPSHQKAIARHEIRMKMEDIFVCAKEFLKPEGRLSVILPIFRETDFLLLAERYGFHWIEKRYVHSFKEEVPAFFLASLSLARRKFTEHPSLVIYDSPGVYTPELQRMLEEDFSHG